ncbi:MAG: hypothetical protein VKK05_01115 [Synechococcus sp.]|nr:hypothetical protein [Synechococcus sp.]
MLLTLRADGAELFRKFQRTYVVQQKFSRTISVGLLLVDLDKYHDIKPEHMIYSQVLSYSKHKGFGDEDGRSTNVHETVHFINNALRNHYKKLLKKNVNGFYADNGKGIIVENPPSVTMRDIVPNIPIILRGYRYELYFVKQLGDWNEVPTYPMDEWTAYIAGAECAVDDINNGITIPKSDYISGALEFSIYCTALAITVKEKNLSYWNTNEQFKNAIKYFLIKSEKVFAEGHDKFASDKQDILLYNLRKHKDAQKIRQFLLEEFEGIFVD